MIVSTKYGLGRIGHGLKTGTHRIAGRCSGGREWPEEPLYYIVEDLVEHETHHVLVSDRPTWGRYLHAREAGHE